ACRGCAGEPPLQRCVCLSRRRRASAHGLVPGHDSLFFFNHAAPAEIYTLSLHDALPICSTTRRIASSSTVRSPSASSSPAARRRSEEHTSELQSQSNLVCRLLLEKKKQKAQEATNDSHLPPVPSRHGVQLAQIEVTQQLA